LKKGAGSSTLKKVAGSSNLKRIVIVEGRDSRIFAHENIDLEFDKIYKLLQLKNTKTEYRIKKIEEFFDTRKFACISGKAVVKILML